jgi:hypothetical protein
MGLSFTITSGRRQRSHSQVRVPRDSWLYFTVSDLRLPPSWGRGRRIYIPQEQGGPVIPLGTWFVTQLACNPRYKASGRSQQKKTVSQQFLYDYWSVFTSPLHRNGSSSIFACVFVATEMSLPSRCLAIYVSSDFTIPAFGRHVTISS